MTASCPDADSDSDSDLHEPPQIAALCASIEVFRTSLTSAHPALLSRHPGSNLEAMALLLHMRLDECRHLLRAYDFLTLGDACWRFRSDVDHEPKEGDAEDLPF